MLNTIFWAGVVLGILIIVHELGHFLVARYFGVRVLTFSLGFGPRLGSWKGRLGTEYQICAVPLGGYVKMFGESHDDEEEISEAERPLAFTHKGVWQRFSIVFAGPAFNFIFAIVALTLAYMVGVGELLPVVGTVSPGMPAAAAGLQSGDRITYVDEQAIDRWETMSQIIRASGGRKLSLTVDRNGRVFQVAVMPKVKEVNNLFGEAVQLPLIGIGPSGAQDLVRYSPWMAIVKGGGQAWSMTELTATSIWKLITQVISADQIGGPLLIAEMAGKTAQQGPSNFLFFMALISVNLGILNLLPVPILDGGHLFFFLVEAVKGSPVAEPVQMIANRVGVGLLVMLMMWAMKNDVTRLMQ